MSRISPIVRGSVPLLLAGSIGCAGSLPGSHVDGDTQLPPRFREVSAPKVCLAKRRLLTELGHKELSEAAAATDRKGEKEPRLDRDDPPAIEVAYGSIAPATVLIRTSEGMGSGVIIDRRGYVLTNEHVVDEFLQPDLTIKVSLELGEVGPTGRVVPSKKVYQGVVVKADGVRDLALVKIVDPPEDLPVASLAPVDPRVGERVLSVGNAGIGLLWAAKVCNVSRIGDLTRETSMLEAGDCALRDPGDDDDEAKRKEEQCEARKKETKQQVEESPQGLSIQTTCGLNGGDSGGPLVNAWGEVVGLNASVRRGMSPLAFHIHVAEVRDFVAEIPAVAAAVVPDPYCEGGVDFRVEDYDGDGVTDAAVAEDMPHFSAMSMKPNGTYLFDLDQRTANAGAAPSPARPFHADVAVLLKGEDAYVFYDRDGDGAFDYLLRDRKADGKPELAYTLKGDTVEKDGGPLPENALDPSVLQKRAGIARLGALASSSGLARFASAETLASAAVPALPNVAKVFGKRGRAFDVDDDKTPDAVFGFGSGFGQESFLVDIRSSALRGLKPGDDAKPVLDPWKVTPQFVFLERASGAWALYDRDANGTFDLALFGKTPANQDDDMPSAPSFATHAFNLENGKIGAPLPELVGRSLVRDDLVIDAALKRAISKGPMSRRSQRGSFPSPFGVVYEEWTFRALEKDRQVLEQSGKQGHVALVDLDRDTKKLTTSEASALASDEKFDAEVAFVRLGDAGWAYYDTNGDGAFDTFLYANDVDAGVVDNAVQLTPDGRDAATLPHEGGLFRPELVKANPSAKSKLAELFASVAAKPAPANRAGAKGAPPPPPPPKR